MGMEELDPIETASLDELRSLQTERLRATIQHTYANVAHYREAWDAAGVHPDDVRELADLAKLPFTTKADLRANYPFGMFAVPREQVVRVHASSGTTGQPTVVGYTAEDVDMWADRDGAQHPRGRRPARATCCTTPTATGCSPAASAPTTAPRSSAAPSSRSPAA